MHIICILFIFKIDMRILYHTRVNDHCLLLMIADRESITFHLLLVYFFEFPICKFYSHFVIEL